MERLLLVNLAERAYWRGRQRQRNASTGSAPSMYFLPPGARLQAGAASLPAAKTLSGYVGLGFRFSSQTFSSAGDDRRCCAGQEEGREAWHASCGASVTCFLFSASVTAARGSLVSCLPSTTAAVVSFLSEQTYYNSTCTMLLRPGHHSCSGIHMSRLLPCLSSMDPFGTSVL